MKKTKEELKQETIAAIARDIGEMLDNYDAIRAGKSGKRGSNDRRRREAGAPDKNGER